MAQQSLADTLIGGGAVAFFAFVWVSSAASPIIFALSVYFQLWRVCLFMAAIATAAYAPGVTRSKTLVDTMRNALSRALSDSSVGFEEGGAPDGTPRLYAVHPHGIFSLGWASLFLHPSLSSVTFCFSPFLYYSPFFRLYARLVGRPGRADKDYMLKLMRAGQHQALIPGGFEEASITSGGEADRVFIKSRAGFIKYCLQHGVVVCPVYAFGEKSLYGNVQGGWALRFAMNKQGLPAVLPTGRHPLLPLLPRAGPLHVVVGSPLVLGKIDKPSAEEVAAAHAAYMQSLVALFDRHKVRVYGEAAERRSLEVW